MRLMFLKKKSRDLKKIIKNIVRLAEKSLIISLNFLSEIREQIKSLILKYFHLFGNHFKKSRSWRAKDNPLVSTQFRIKGGLIEYLIEKGTDVNAQDKNGNTALQKKLN